MAELTKLKMCMFCKNRFTPNPTGVCDVCKEKVKKFEEALAR